MSTLLHMHTLCQGMPEASNEPVSYSAMGNRCDGICWGALQSMLDEMEICLEAMGICVAAVDAPVDFDHLPVIKLRAGLMGVMNGSQEDSAGGGTGLQGDSDEEQVEEDPQEELGDSTLEAQARGTPCIYFVKCRGSYTRETACQMQ